MAKKKTNKPDMMLLISGIAAIITAVLMIFSLSLPFLGVEFITYVNLVMSVLMLIFPILVLIGYAVLSKKIKSIFLWIISLIAIIFVVIVPVIYLAIVYMKLTIIPFFVSWLVITLAIIYVLFGVAVLKLRKLFGSLVIAISVLYMIRGVIYIFGLYFFILSLGTIFFGIILSILEAVLFFKAAKKF